MKFISFTVPIMPVGKERPRSGRNGVYTPKKTRDFEKSFKTYAAIAMREHRMIMLTKTKIHLSLVFSFPANKINVSPDLDNLAKAAGDAMNQIVYDDDRYIMSMEALKCIGMPSIYVEVNII